MLSNAKVQLASEDRASTDRREIAGCKARESTTWPPLLGQTDWSIRVSGSRPVKSLMRKFSSLKDVLPLALGQVAFRTTSAGPLWVIWAELVGPAVANNAAPVSLVGGTLIVEAHSLTWVEELTRQAPQLVLKLQARLGGTSVVRSLTFRVKG